MAGWAHVMVGAAAAATCGDGDDDGDWLALSHGSHTLGGACVCGGGGLC